MKTAKALTRNGKRGKSGAFHWNLRLYVAGESPKCMAALSNLKRICDKHIGGQYSLEIVDLLRNPQMAQYHQILAVPTLVRTLPEPIRKIIGDLSDSEKVVLNLNLTEFQ